MKANLTNLRKALKASADAHKVEFHWWRNDGQITLKSESVPVLADVRMICEAFFGHADMVETDYGYTIVWLGDGFRESVDEVTLALALPAGTDMLT